MVTQSSNVFFVVKPFIRLDFANVALNTSFLYASSIMKSSGKKLLIRFLTAQMTKTAEH